MMSFLPPLKIMNMEQPGTPASQGGTLDLKSLGPPRNPKNPASPKINPPKSHAEFSSLKNFQKGLTHKSQVKDIKNSLQQKGIPVRIKPGDKHDG